MKSLVINTISLVENGLKQEMVVNWSGRLLPLELMENHLNHSSITKWRLLPEIEKELVPAPMLVSHCMVKNRILAPDLWNHLTVSPEIQRKPLELKQLILEKSQELELDMIIVDSLLDGSLIKLL